MEKLFEEREIFSFDAKDNRIMCFPHIINITVQHTLKVMSSVEAPENDDDSEDLIEKSNSDEGRGFGQSFDAACAQDPIARVRKIVMTIRSSGQRRDAFMKWIETGNKSGLFVANNKPVQIQPKQLLRDVRTRWDSTYQMIKRCIEMRLVSLHSSMISIPKPFALGNRHLSHTTRKRSREFRIDEERMGSAPRVRIHPQRKSLHIHPVTNSHSFSSPTASNKLCPAIKLPCSLGLSPSSKYSLADGKHSRRNDSILNHLFNQGWTKHASIIRGQISRRPTLSECVRPVHQLVLRVYRPLITSQLLTLLFGCRGS